MKKREIKTWRDVWGPYFHYHWGYVMDNFSTSAFSIDLNRRDDDPFIEQLGKSIAEVLETGNELKIPYERLEIKDGCDLYLGDIRLGAFRGWGYLTGTGGLNLPEERATELQDQMIDYVMKRICKDYGLKEGTGSSPEE